MLKKVDLALDSHHDFALLASTMALVSLGLTMVFISSTVMANSQYQDPYFFVKRQTIYALLGVGVLVLGRSTDYHRYKNYVYWFLFAALIGLVLVFLPGLGTKVRGAARWLRLGPLTLQPSEFAKLAMVMFLAYSLSRKQEKMKYFAIGFLPHMMIAGVFIALIGKEPDFGTALTLAGIVFIMLLVGGTRLTYILISFCLAVPLAVVMVLRDPKKFSRILSFLDPWKYGQDVGYQLKQSLLAIGSGGFWGMGPGQSRAKLFYLPDAHTDFILSIIGEELGLAGTLIVILLFVVFVWQGARIAKRTTDAFGYFLSVGIVSMIGLQAVINVGVSIGALPTKGLTLPFISYGGSGLIFNMISVGLLLNISRVQDL
jgi:cell division protein FtsW